MEKKKNANNNIIITNNKWTLKKLFNTKLKSNKFLTPNTNRKKEEQEEK